ncbi:MAG: hypothetical protein QNJ31_05115 [Candidatus Caenarcaniphilales bacterium]|nr:hypothetical protein [Candidatus Caenarcaniphilales bacterium]
MDFRTASEKLDSGQTNQEEITNQILNLPCIYGIFKDQSKIFCLEVNNKQTNGEITVALLYSNLKIAVEATSSFKIPNNWYVAQWSDIEEALKACSELSIDAVAFDSIPQEDTLSGLVIDKDSLKELIWLSHSTH